MDHCANRSTHDPRCHRQSRSARGLHAFWTSALVLLLQACVPPPNGAVRPLVTDGEVVADAAASDAGPSPSVDAPRGDGGSLPDAIDGGMVTAPSDSGGIAAPLDAGGPSPTVDSGPRPASSRQLVVLDVRYTHNTTSRAFSFFPLRADMPANLVSPIDYAHGTVHERLEVIAKPSARDIRYQMCFFQDAHQSAKHACVSQRGLAFTGPGVYTFEQEMPTIYQFGNLAWTRALLDLMLVVKDAGGAPVDDRYGFDGDWAGSPDFSQYYPMEVRFTAVLVPPGETFAGF